MRKSILAVTAALILALAVRADLLSFLSGGVASGGGGGGGYNWTLDSALKGLYLFESGAFEQDSSGKGNHIDDRVSAGIPFADTGDKIQGGQSAGFSTAGDDDGFVLNTSAASADFPCVGATSETTWAGWAKFGSFGTTRYLLSMQTGAQRMASNASGNLICAIDGLTGVHTLTTDATMTPGEWWFLALSYSASSNELRAYLRKQGSGSSTWETASTSVEDLDTSASSQFCLGVRRDSPPDFGMQGTMDAWAIFNGIAMTQADLDGVFANGWDGNGW